MEELQTNEKEQNNGNKKESDNVEPEQRSSMSRVEHLMSRVVHPMSRVVHLMSRVVHLMSIMTVEPMLFFQFLGLSLKSVAESQMILYKTCRGKINKK